MHCLCCLLIPRMCGYTRTFYHPVRKIEWHHIRQSLSFGVHSIPILIQHVSEDIRFFASKKVAPDTRVCCIRSKVAQRITRTAQRNQRCDRVIISRRVCFQNCNKSCYHLVIRHLVIRRRHHFSLVWCCVLCSFPTSKRRDFRRVATPLGFHN